jgi:hypothetical protein
MPKRSAKPIKPPDYQGVSAPEELECFCQATSFSFRAAYGIGEDLGAVSLFERIKLEVKGLILG